MKIKSIKNLADNRTELVCKYKISPKSTFVSHLSVPTDKADEFCISYKKQQKNSNLLSFIATTFSTALGAFMGGNVAKKSILSWAGAIVGGIAFGLGTLSIANRQIYKSQQKLFTKYNVQQISYQVETVEKSEHDSIASSDK